MTKYSKTAILLHWAIAILVVTNVVLVSMAEELPRAACIERRRHDACNG